MRILINLGLAAVATALAFAIALSIAYIIWKVTFREPSKEEEDRL